MTRHYDKAGTYVPVPGARLRYLRKYLGLTRAQLAAAAGVTETMVAHYEFGRRPITPTAVARFERAFGPEAGEFLIADG